MCDEPIPKVVNTGELIFKLDRESITNLLRLLTDFNFGMLYSEYFDDYLSVKIYTPNGAVEYLQRNGSRKRLSVKFLIINSEGAYLDCECVPYIEDKHLNYLQPLNLQLPLKGIVGPENCEFMIPISQCMLTGSYAYQQLPINKPENKDESLDN